MKHLKMLGLIVMAAASLMAFAGSASASVPVLTYPHGTEYTGEIDFSAEESLFLEASVIQITCTESTVKGTITKNTDPVASGPISTLSFSKCGESTVDVLAKGSLEVNEKGEVFAKENRVTTERFGISCVFGGGTGTKISTIPTTTTVETAQISATLPKQSGSSFLCPSTASWTGAYTLTEPAYLVVDDTK